MATDLPESSHSSVPPPLSVKTYHIAGILTDVFGLGELPTSCRSVSCLWLLHQRLQTKEKMALVASDCINDWNQRGPADRKVGLIAVAFDQRNHGSRKVDRVANEAWRQGNVNHAQDMFSILHGTAVDVSLLIDHLASYVFNTPDAPPIEQHLVLGISLGGHSAWQVLFNEPRVRAAVIIVGCPDYMRLMSDRARLSKLMSYTSTNGTTFLGSQDFPQALITSCKRYDPKGILFSASEIAFSASTSPALLQSLESKIGGKRVLVCSGGADKLVPYHCAQPFMRFLREATKGGDIYVEDNVYEDVGHEFSENMRKDSVRFISDTLAGEKGKATARI